MRLSKIKLAGFKSFVDPTTITFPSSLVGVVGPNGCGKSNVIDAVRWVMGESSASRLRGDSITDVIFNGSSSRKPIGSASVELLFDNSDTTLEGQYAKYAEISIRRVVSRDGISNYFLNGTRCRRKDITGVFLGTGLGPRSYSIIEQGMISRMIEAKPEEMRVFLEEAAGISKYKERRRETSNRIKHTKENLDRLLDVLEEVEKQIKHLDRQAKTAERYSRYKADERKMSAELLALRTRDLDDRAAESKVRLSECKTRLEETIAKQRSLEAALEDTRIRQGERSDEFNIVQGRYYKVGSEIARLEQSIEHARELRQRQESDLEQAILGAREIDDHIAQDRNEIEQLDLTLNELVPGLEQARQTERRTSESLQAAESALADWQKQWDAHSLRYNRALQQQNVENTRAEQIESRLQSFTERRKKLDEAQSSASLEDLQSRHEEIAEQELRKRQARDEFDRHLTDTAEKIRKLREQDQKLSRLVDERRASLQDGEGKYASLQALQNAAMGVGDEGVRSWLTGAGLDKNQRVAKKLKVAGGWEQAVETVLGDYLQAVCVADITPVTEAIAKLRTGSVTVFREQAKDEGLDEAPANTLATKVTGAPAAVAEMLSKVQIATSLGNALTIRESLSGAGSVVTEDGIWLGKNWLRVSRTKGGKAGVLTREHDMRRMKSDIREMRARFESARKLQRDGRTRLTQLEERRETLQQDASSLLNEYSEIKAELESARYRLDQASARKAALAEEAGELDGEKISAEEQLRESRRIHGQAIESMEQLDAEKASLEAQRDELRAESQRVRAQAEESRQAVQDITIQFESRRTSKESAAQNLARMQTQLAVFQRREEEIREQLEQSQSPLVGNKESLEEQLAARIVVEEELAAARGKVEKVENELRELDQSRLQADQKVDAARARLSEAEMAVQELRVRREGFTEQLSQTDFDLELLLDGLDEESGIEVWEEKLDKVRKRIDRLGPINLAAIDEFKEQSERKEYLDSQLADLNDALATLEGAIRKIDRETRTRFRETYNKVNDGFKRLFPKLFGGGHAYLELTGDDLLSAGIAVMARPPGKRNSTIHLLSGGEKALAAVALVFAIFELNPAPFCMLDEVDAPLDDANVTRYCEIVKEMSDKVQFIFITHNKVTMELARQLSGVTMQEPGVSRLVSVDLDAAVKMAAS
ncbi:MAG: chromosome segregation protein SMC [Gammaproteobacteria bacterium]|nr:chromosome segregation protein SMC [Gammaproteobacteria bacterium]MBT8110041.1 chromosome segregation protein SMC [Gammaproteobacteria bacterium]NND46720.1 chromosome segregation protein SMC [Woeseiaceae bacterium]NNL44745.1 chromosome segregation protein SMC [Woeseiaceae bacterium]